MVTVNCLAYNHKNYIKKALDGFIMQKTNFQFEVVIHDDASTDGTTDIIREYEEKYPSIIKPIYEEKNQFHITGRIRSIMRKRWNGKYIAFCEGDDYWTDPLKLQKQVDYLENHPNCSFSFHNAAVIWNNGKIKEHHFLPDTMFKSASLKKGNIYYAEDIINIGFIPTASIVARKECISERYDLFCDNPVCGDLPLRLNLVLHGFGYYIDQNMSVYRTGNPNSASGKSFNNNAVALNNLKGHIRILRGFDKYSNYKWHNEVEYDIKRRLIRYYINNGNYNKIKSGNLKSVYINDIYRVKRIKYMLKNRCSFIYRLIKRIRNKACNI